MTVNRNQAISEAVPEHDSESEFERISMAIRQKNNKNVI
jgi:hypothetical protein